MKIRESKDRNCRLNSIYDNSANESEKPRSDQIALIRRCLVNEMKNGRFRLFNLIHEQPVNEYDEQRS